MEPGTQHLLRVTNSVGTEEFSVQFDASRRCECREAGDSLYTGAEISSDVTPLLRSCVSLGSSLLETYLPDGNRRQSGDREAEFERQVEDFFRQASCSKYAYEMLEKYREGQSGARNQDIFVRNSGNAGSSPEVIFHKLDPTDNTEVKKTRAEINDGVNKELIEEAENILAKKDAIAISKKDDKDDMVAAFPLN